MTAKSRLWAAAIATALLAGASCAAQTTSAESEEEISYKTEELFAQGPYRFLVEQRFDKSPDQDEALAMDQTLIILKDGREIDRRKGWRWDLDTTPGMPDAGYAPPAAGTDITGDGIPDVVLKEYSGGAHCCSTYYVIELRTPLVVHEFYTADYGAIFEQLDGQGALEVETSDTAFTYWRAPFVSSAAPTVVLRYSNGAYVPAPDLMSAPPPSDAEMAQWAKESHEGFGWDMQTKPRGTLDVSDLESVFLDRVTQLIYEGHAGLVRKFVDLAWPAAKSGKEDFINELMECRIRHSKYWPTIAAMNGLSADPPIGKCPAEDG